MNLEQLNSDEEPLSRESLLRIKGGAASLYTAYRTGECVDTGGVLVSDCDDMLKD